VKKLLASRVAAKLAQEHNRPVSVVKGNVLEFSVSIGEETVFQGNPLWYPWPNSVIKRVREVLNEEQNRNMKNEA